MTKWRDSGSVGFAEERHRRQACRPQSEVGWIPLRRLFPRILITKPSEVNPFFRVNRSLPNTEPTTVALVGSVPRAVTGSRSLTSVAGAASQNYLSGDGAKTCSKGLIAIACERVQRR